MLFFSPDRRSSLKFIALFILVPIAVVTPAPVTGGPSGSNELKSVIISFPTELQNAYPLFLIDDDRNKLEPLVKAKIAVGAKALMQRKELSEGDMELQGSLTLFRDHATKRYVVPYELSSIDKKSMFKGMALEMWFEHDGSPKAALVGKKGRKVTRNPVIGPEGLLDIAVESFVVAINFENEAVAGAEPLKLRGAYQGLLDHSECLSADVTHDVEKSINIKGLDEQDVKILGYPSVLVTSERYIVPYKLLHFSKQTQLGYNRGRLEVLKEQKGEPALEFHTMNGNDVLAVRRTPNSSSAKILMQIAEMGVNADSNPRTDAARFSQLMKLITKKDDWNTERNVKEFVEDHSFYGIPEEEPHFHEFKELVYSQAGIPLESQAQHSYLRRPLTLVHIDDSVGPTPQDRANFVRELLRRLPKLD
ncbi:hypothetical protein C8R42DRAFT_725718 [Lentinula raphanica]|nr:hypothetical protein C8R42DRAFT_725718 [Lentinula raphanica]